MSCGRLHEQGGELHFHAPAEEHEPEAVFDVEAVDEIDGPPKEPGRVRTAITGAWARHGHAVKPFAVIPAMEGSEWFIEQVYGGDWARALAAAGAVMVTSEGVSELVNWRHRAVAPVKAKTRLAVAVGGAMAAIGGAGIFNEWTALATLIAGLATGGMVAWEERKAHGLLPARPAYPYEPPAIESPAGPDPRLLEFTAEFCQENGPLAGVTATLFREIPNGFMFELHMARTGRSPDDVGKLVIPVAQLYHVRKEGVSVGYVDELGKDNENFCQVIVTKRATVSATERAKPQLNKWDGQSSWNPETGTFDLGYFKDLKVTHYREHKPRSGAMMGFIAGVPDSGKTGTLNVLAGEAGKAMLCSRCGKANNKYSPGECGKCDMHRVMAVWMGDAQAQGMTLWNGRADLSGTGPEGSVELLEFANAVYDRRGPQMASMEWWDADPYGRARHNTGKGFFDLEIGFPLIDLTIDEWPALILHPDIDLRNTAKALILRALTLWRKRGLHFKGAAQTLDLSLIGLRELREIMKFFNVVAHRLDESSAHGTGITGNPLALPLDIPGSGFISGIDRRSGPADEFATKYCPEVSKPGETGMDIRHVAGEIAQTPIRYDAAVTDLMAEWQIQHQHVFEEWGRFQQEKEPPAATVQQAPVTLSAVPSPFGMAYREDADKVREALASRPGPWGRQELMLATKLNLGPLMAALEALKANGQAVDTGDKQYQAA